MACNYPRLALFRRCNKGSVAWLGRPWVPVLTTFGAAGVAVWQAAATTSNVPVVHGMVHIRAPWLPVFGFALLGGGATYAAIWLVFLAGHLCSYLCSRFQDDSWVADGTMFNIAHFTLKLREGAVPDTVTTHGLMLCVVRDPDGEMRCFTPHDPERLIFEHGSQEVYVQGTTAPQPGDYKVRWYGANTTRKRYYEITRKTIPGPTR
jgi:hypothetical protein